MPDDIALTCAHEVFLTATAGTVFRFFAFALFSFGLLSDSSYIITYSLSGLEYVVRPRTLSHTPVLSEPGQLHKLHNTTLCLLDVEMV